MTSYNDGRSHDVVEVAINGMHSPGGSWEKFSSVTSRILWEQASV